MKMKRCIIAAAASAMLFLNGCMDVTTQINVKKDGSGTIVYKVLFTKEVIAMMDQMAAMSNQMTEDENTVGKTEKPKEKSVLEKSIDKTEMEKQAKSLGEGVTFESAKLIDGPEERKGYESVFAFKNVEKITIQQMPENKMDQNAETSEKEKKEKPVHFKFAKKGENATLTILMPEEKKDKKKAEAKNKKEKKEPAAEPEQNEEMKKQMLQMFKGFRVRVLVTTEGTVFKTNATYFDKESKVFTLIDMDLGKLLEDEKMVKELEGLQQGDKTAELKEKLKNVKSVKFETEPKVTIEFK